MLPHVCVLCGALLDDGHFCNACKADLPWISSSCERCGQPLASSLPPDTHCADCQSRPPLFDKAVAPLLYQFPVDSALKALKFRRRLHYAPAFGELLLPLFEKCFADVDALLPVPLHWSRHATRGFNQAAEICRPIRKKNVLPLIENVRRVKSTPPQTGLSAVERRRNMTAAFEVRGPLRFRRPLIVDDVITTGETCRQLAGALLDAGVEKVSVLAIARAASP